MRVMLLVKATPDSEAGVLPDEKLLAEMATYTEELVKSGVLLDSCLRLQPSSDGVRVRCANGEFVVTDGPFAETKELIGGFCLVQAESTDDAVKWAKRIPFQEGEVTVRPLLELSDFPADVAPRRQGTVRYVGLVKADRDTEAGILPVEQFQAAMGAFLKEAVNAGVLLAADALQPTSKGARVHFSGQKRMVTDGPFAETKELIAGFMILQFTSKAEAIEWTKNFVQLDAPGRLGAESECELRPIFEFEDFGPSAAIDRFREMGAGTRA